MRVESDSEDSEDDEKDHARSVGSGHIMHPIENRCRDADIMDLVNRDLKEDESDAKIWRPEDIPRTNIDTNMMRLGSSHSHNDDMADDHLLNKVRPTQHCTPISEISHQDSARERADN